MLQDSFHNVFLVLVAVMFCITAWTAAGEVTLSNGDRITGKIVKSDGKTLTIKSDLSGDVTTDLTAIPSPESRITI